MRDRRSPRESFSPPAIGGASLLVVFAVLCLTVFALLSLSTVRADVRLAEKSRDALGAYYAADCEAQAIFAHLRQDDLPDGVEMWEDFDFDHPAVYYAYTVPISDTQELRVELEQRDGGWTVTRWQSAPAGDWVPDDSLDLWGGELFEDDPILWLGRDLPDEP